MNTQLGGSIGAILVPLDGSTFAEAGLERALQLAEATRARLHLVQVRTLLSGPEPGPGDEPARTIEEAVEAYLGRTAERAAAHLGHPVLHALLRDRKAERAYGGPSRVGIARLLSAYARRHAIELIVLTTHGRGGFSRAWLGSVADALVRRSPVPLLLVRVPEPRAGPPAPFRRVLIPIDASTDADLVIRPARAVASAGATFTLLRVVAPTYEQGRAYSPGRLQTEGGAVAVLENAAMRELEDIASRMHDGVTRIRLATPVARDAARAILQTADAEGVDLIALTTRGRKGLARSVLGSVADKVVRGAECSVLVANPGGRKSLLATEPAEPLDER